jgi:hypothetical protein
VGQCGPEKARELARDRGDDVLFGFASRGEPTIAPVQAMLRLPGLFNHRRRRAALAQTEGAPDKRVMPIVPGGLDQDAPDVGIAGLGDPAAGLFGPAGVRLLKRRDRPALGLQPGGVPRRPCSLGRRKSAPVAQEKLREAVPRAPRAGWHRADRS